MENSIKMIVMIPGSSIYVRISCFGGGFLRGEFGHTFYTLGRKIQV